MYVYVHKCYIDISMTTHDYQRRILYRITVVFEDTQLIANYC